MIIKYAVFLFTLLWSYTFIKSQSIFRKGSGILITLFVTNISWFTFIAACFYGFKNFIFYYALLRIALSIILVHLAFSRLKLFINNKFQDKNTLLKIKTFIEYLILITLFVTNISWITFIAACFYGLKNFSFYHALLGIALSVILVQLAFSRMSLFINNKFKNKDTLLKIKTFIEYLILIAVVYFIFF